MSQHSGGPTTKQLVEHIHEMMHENKQASEFHTHLLRRILRKVGKMAGEIDRIETDTAAMAGSVASAVSLLGKLADLIKANVNDPVRLGKIADDLEASKQALADAVVANDPDTPPADPNA